MNKVVVGLAALLLSSAAYAQTSTDQGASSGSSQMRVQSGQSQTEGKTGAHQSATAGSHTRQGIQADVRSRTEHNTRVGVGIETRERSGVSVRLWVSCQVGRCYSTTCSCRC